jgi:uncharacterized glyoxalase superfamily protein PhnB
MSTPSDLYPCLTYSDARAAIDWLCKVFGFTKRLIVDGPDNSVRHSELSLGTAVIMISSPREERIAPTGGQHFGLSVYVADPDDHHRQAVAGGAKITQPLRDEEYGARGYSVQDLEGYQWYFGNYRPGTYWEDTANK